MAKTGSSQKTSTRSSVRLPAKLKSEVAKALGFYVYALIDPRNNEIFYIGKGKGSRFLAHQSEAVRQSGKSAKAERIRSILDAGHTPSVDIIRHGLKDEKTAFLVESVLIDALPGLTNKVSGHDADRLPLDELIVRYAAPELSNDAPPAVMIRLRAWQDAPEKVERGYTRKGHGWRSGMPLEELADSTRAWWKISPDTVDRKGAQHAVAVCEGITRGVFEIGKWIGPRKDGRRAFHALPVVSGPVFDSYIGDVGKRLPAARGSQNPITYWPA
ncbi:MAG: hypothetical protein RIE08_09030 [Acidimicrobiales bacterium]